MQLRGYQQDGKSAILKQWEEVNSTLVVMPTGTGKTVLFASIIEARQPHRAIVIAHREELIWQARDKIERTTGLDCAIEMGELYVNNSLFGDSAVIISTIQTQSSLHGDRKRMGRFRPGDFGTLIIDEAHHATADTYRNLIHYYRQNPELRVLGVTATPDRGDEEALGQVFDSVAFDYEILDAIHDGWLVPVEQQFVHIDGLDFSHVRTTAGDLNGADLNAVMEAEHNLQGVAGASFEIARGRRTIVFTASVKQAEVICNIFNRHQPGMAEWVCAKTNRDQRREMLAKFESGIIQVVCNCGVLTEGFDNPGVEVIVMARPTKSRALYAQMAGRSMRPLTGIVDGLESPDERKLAIGKSPKPSCLIVDFVGNSGRHKLMSSADILGGKVREEVLERAVRKAKEKGGAVRMSDEIDEAEKEMLKEAEQRRQAEEARKAKLVAGVRYTSQRVNPFDAFQIQPYNERGWDHGKTLTVKQRALLLRQGINPEKVTYTHGKQLIGEMFRRWDQKLCSLRQAQVLRRYGYDTRDLPRAAASRMLDALARNNWRRPDGMASR